MDARGESSRPDLADLLARHRDALVRILANEGRGLLRFESAEDLAQGVHLHALRVHDRFEWQGEEAFLGWLRALARQHVADRNAWWKALKRNAGPVLRLSLSPANDATGVPAIQAVGAAMGPVTFADRRHQLELAARALASLPERDRELVRHLTEDVSVDESARRLGIGYAAAQRARLRAMERFRKAYAVVARAEGRRELSS